MAKKNQFIGSSGKADLSTLKQISSGRKGIQSVSADISAYNDWPLAKYSFEVTIGGFLNSNVSFQAMDGLGAEIATMKFRDGNSNKFYEQSRPTLTSYSPVTLKKGVFVGDDSLFKWFSNVSSGVYFSDMRTVTIHLSELVGDKHSHIFTWTLEKAYVTKFTPSNLDGEADTEIAIEEIEITYQSFSMNSGALGMIGNLLGL